jgi:hypothetical protein
MARPQRAFSVFTIGSFHHFFVFNGWADSPTVKQCGILGPKAQIIFRNQKPGAGGRKSGAKSQKSGRGLQEFRQFNLKTELRSSVRHPCLTWRAGIPAARIKRPEDSRRMEFSSGRARRKVFSAGLEATALRQARMPAATAQVSESDFGVRV